MNKCRYLLISISVLVLWFERSNSENWLNTGADHGHSRSRKHELGPGLRSFQLAFTAELPFWSGGSLWEPLVLNNTIYVMTQSDAQVWAIDSESGEIKRTTMIHVGLDRRFAQPFISEALGLLFTRSFSPGTGLMFHAISLPNLELAWQTTVSKVTGDFGEYFGDVVSDERQQVYFRNGSEILAVNATNGDFLFSVSTFSGETILGQALSYDSRLFVSVPGGVAELPIDGSSATNRSEVTWEWAGPGFEWLPAVCPIDWIVISSLWPNATSLVLTGLWYGLGATPISMWKSEPENYFDVRTSAPAVTEDMAYLVCGINRDKICIIDISEGTEGQVIDTFDLDVELQASPVVTPDYIFAMISGGIVAVERKTKDVFHVQNNLDDGASGSFFIVNDGLVFHTENTQGSVSMYRLYAETTTEFVPTFQTDATSTSEATVTPLTTTGMSTVETSTVESSSTSEPTTEQTTEMDSTTTTTSTSVVDTTIFETTIEAATTVPTTEPQVQTTTPNQPSSPEIPTTTTMSASTESSSRPSKPTKRPASTEAPPVWRHYDPFDVALVGVLLGGALLISIIVNIFLGIRLHHFKRRLASDAEVLTMQDYMQESIPHPSELQY